MPDTQGKSALFYVGKRWVIFGFPGLVGQSERQSREMVSRLTEREIFLDLINVLR
jgi:hypothetical protein